MTERGVEMKKTIIFLLIMSVLLSACGSEAPVASEEEPLAEFIESAEEETIVVSDIQQGINEVTEVFIKAEDSTTLGDLEREGWRLEISEGTFLKSGNLHVEKIVDVNHEMTENSEFDMLAPPMTFRFDEKNNTRLNNPARLTFKLPTNVLDTLQHEELFYGYFYDGQWEFYTPQVIDLEQGIVSFDLYHFSGLGLGKPSEEEQINTYARMMAAKNWQQQQDSEALKAMVKPGIDQMLIEMNIKVPDLRNQLSADILTYLESGSFDMGGVAPIDALGQMVHLLHKGEAGKEAFKEKLTEFIAKGMVLSLEKDVEKFASKYNALTNLSKAAGALYEGDRRGALEHVANMLKSAVPLAAVADSASKYVQEKGNQLIDTWADDELDKAYKAYAYGTDKWGYDEGLKGDFDSVMTLLGGGERQFEIRTIEKYCKKSGADPNKLTEAERNKIINRARESLRKSFDERYVKEQELMVQSDEEDALIAKEKVFVKSLKEEGLLNWHNYKDLFQIDDYGHNYDVRNRLDHLYKMRALIKNMMPKGIYENLSNEDMAKIIDRWIYAHSKKDQNLFYDYMRERGFLKEALPMPDHVWVLDKVVDYDAGEEIADKNKSYEGIYHYEGSYGQGQYRIQQTYIGKSDDYYNPPKVEGESIAFLASFSQPPEMLIAGESLSIDVSLSPVGNSLSFYAFNGSIRAQLNRQNFENAEGKYSFKSDNQNDYESFNERLSAVIPGGSEDSALIISYSLYSSVSMKTEYVYVYRPLE